MMTWSIRPGERSARSSAARAAAAPSSIADTPASAPPFCPSPRLPPTHSAIGVRAPERITTSGSALLGKVLLLVSNVMGEVGAEAVAPPGAGAGDRRGGQRAGVSALRCATLAPVARGGQAARAPTAWRPREVHGPLVQFPGALKVPESSAGRRPPPRDRVEPKHRT